MLSAFDERLPRMQRIRLEDVFRSYRINMFWNPFDSSMGSNQKLVRVHVYAFYSV